MTDATNNFGGDSPSRLDRIESLLATTAERLDRVAESQERGHQQHNQEMAEIRAGLRETRSIADSNARSIQAWESRIEDGIAAAEEVSTSMSANTNRRMEEAITDTVAMIADLGRQQQETDQRFNNLLEDARADREEARQQREANATEHRAFTQNIQVLLAEISRLWQRLA
jgi:chromosome segregation ATPase